MSPLPKSSDEITLVGDWVITDEYAIKRLKTEFTNGIRASTLELESLCCFLVGEHFTIFPKFPFLLVPTYLILGIIPRDLASLIEWVFKNSGTPHFSNLGTKSF